MTDGQTETAGRPDEAKLREACQRFVELGDDGMFMTCQSNFELAHCVIMACKSVKHAHEVHQALIDIVRNVREGKPTNPKPTRISG